MTRFVTSADIERMLEEFRRPPKRTMTVTIGRLTALRVIGVILMDVIFRGTVTFEVTDDSP